MNQCYSLEIPVINFVSEINNFKNPLSVISVKSLDDTIMILKELKILLYVTEMFPWNITFVNYILEEPVQCIYNIILVVKAKHKVAMGLKHKYYAIHICVPNSRYISLRYPSCERGQIYKQFGTQILT